MLNARGHAGNISPGVARRGARSTMTKTTLSNGSAPALKPAHPSPKPAVSFQRRVLIAEDNELTCRQLKELLESEGDLHVDTTRDGRQALEALRENFYSIFLTDLKMPLL